MATTAAKMRKISIRFRSLRSMLSIPIALAVC
jgi:hypothetical protein